MSKLQKLQCESCGGHINGETLRCEMCGMQYKLDEDFTLGRVEIYNGRFVTLEGKIAIPAFYMFEFGDDGPRVAQEMTIKKLAEGMAEKILPFMEFQQYYDVHTQILETDARIKIAEPPVRNGYMNMTRWFDKY